MDLKTYLTLERGRQSALAKAIGAHAPDVSRWADGKRPIPFEYGASIELATGGLVTRQEMFPDDWARFWPELVSVVPQKNGPGPGVPLDSDPEPSRRNLLECRIEDSPGLDDMR